MTADALNMPFAPIVVARYAEERSRLTVAFRLILAIPHLILLYFGVIITVILAVVGWFAALILGRLPKPIARFLSQFVLYFTRVIAYVWLLTNSYPPFNLERSDWDVDVELAPGPLNRLAVLFRLILVIPVYLLSSIIAGGVSVCLFFIWLILLFTGRMPRALFDAMTAVLRYQTRVVAYWLMLSSAYPTGLFGDGPEATPPPMPPDLPPPSEVPATSDAAPPPPMIPATEVGAPAFAERPSGRLLLSSTSKRILVLFIVLGVFSSIGQSVYWTATGGGILKPLRARNSFFAANQSFGARVQAFQQTVGQCDTQPEPFRCAQDAERELVEALARFDAAVARVDFPDQVSSEIARVKTASTAFRSAIETLIGADSEEEYFQLVQRLDQTGTEFDAAVLALGTALDRLVTSR